jgi:hypothetical protein
VHGSILWGEMLYGTVLLNIMLRNISGFPNSRVDIEELKIV